MITINLLPEEFRIKVKTVSKYPVKPIAIGVGTVLTLLTLFFYVDFIGAKSSYKKLEKESANILPQSQRLKQLEQEVEQKLKPENIFLNRFVTADKPLTQLMAWSSENLPPSTWLTEFQLTRKGEGGTLMVKGLTLSTKEKSSIELIEMFVHQMKERMADATLSLTTSRQGIKNVEVTEFIATFAWGAGVSK